MKEYKEICKDLKKKLDKKRYIHTMGVAYTAASLAMRYKADMEKAFFAGLLHDCAKYIPDGERVALCKEAEIPVSEAEALEPMLLHAKLGAYFAEKEYSVRDPEILSAITYHTTGCPNMTLLEKIVFVADYIEPNRDQAPNLTEIRELCFEDLDQGVYVILQQTIDHVNQRRTTMDSMTLDAYAYYKQFQKK